MTETASDTFWTSCLARMAGFDLETTGINVEEDRVVTATITHLDGDQPNTRSWLVNPGVEIPEAATAVHGITTEHAREHGTDPGEALRDIVGTLVATMAAGVPVVGMNLSFDFTILDRDCRRHGVPTLGRRLAHERGNGDETISPVLDVYVIDKKIDKYRPGKRQLAVMAQTYGVRLDEAHTSDGDVLGALRIAWRMGQRAQLDVEQLAGLYADRRYPYRIAADWRALGAMTLADLHDAQIEWYAEQAASYADYLRRVGKPEEAAQVCGQWPVRPAVESEQTRI